MSKSESGQFLNKGENTASASVLRDDELEFVSGGFSFGISRTGTVRSFIEIGTTETLDMNA